MWDCLSLNCRGCFSEENNKEINGQMWLFANYYAQKINEQTRRWLSQWSVIQAITWVQISAPAQRSQVWSVCIYNTSSGWGVETGKSLELGASHSSQSVSTEFSERPCLRSSQRRHLTQASGLPVCAHMYTHTHTHRVPPATNTAQCIHLCTNKEKM